MSSGSLTPIDKARLDIIEQYEALIVLACAHLPHDSTDIQKRAARAILAQGPSPEAVALAWPDRRPETPRQPRAGAALPDQMRTDLGMLGASDRLMRAFEETVQQYPDGITPVAAEWISHYQKSNGETK